MGAMATPTRLKRAGVGTFFRPRDLKPLGITYQHLQKLVVGGSVEKIGQGLYRLTSVEPNELETIAMVASAVPAGIVCLLSALRLHDIGTQVPHEIWLALNRKARRPARPPTRLRIVRFSGAMLTYGIQSRSILGVTVRVTSPARTVVDCFRYRHKIGLDVALEALRDAIRARKSTTDEIVRAAEVCHARTVMQTYMQALSP
jgi:predicted transcriptional regulator of viral defense system